MHEWALAESVICTIEKEAERNRLKKIIGVAIKVGELQQIDLDIFRFALESILASTNVKAGITDIVIEIDKGILQCRLCGNEWGYLESIKKLQEDEAEAIHFIPEIAHTYMRCPACGSPDFDIKNGRGVWIEGIEGET